MEKKPDSGIIYGLGEGAREGTSTPKRGHHIAAKNNKESWQ